MIKFIRSAVVLSYFVIFGIGAGVISFMLFPLVQIFVKKENRKLYYSNIIHYSWKFFYRMFEVTKMIKVNVEDKEKITNLSGQIVVASHPSLIDIIILVGLIPKSICLAKQSLTKNFLLKNILTNIYITNDVDIEEFKKNAIDALNQGYNVIIFPTGTRHKPNEELKVHKGAAMLAIAAQKPVVPISIKCSYGFLQAGQPIYECGSKIVMYNIKLMPEIDTMELQKDASSEISLRNLISKKIKESIS